MTKVIKVGVIGVGVMGERHCRVYSNLRHVRLVGVADQRAERGKMVAANYETQYFENYRDLLTEVDAVSIVTITPAHFELAMAALEAGVDVLRHRVGAVVAHVRDAQIGVGVDRRRVHLVELRSRVVGRAGPLVRRMSPAGLVKCWAFRPRPLEVPDARGMPCRNGLSNRLFQNDLPRHRHRHRIALGRRQLPMPILSMYHQ